jgi:hypothetical protein
MAVELTDFVAALKRSVEPPGGTIFAGVGNSTWIGYLSDAFWEARLDGFLADYTLEDEVLSHLTLVNATDKERQAMALVILYASIKVLRNRILNMGTSTKLRAKAGPVEFEQENANSATMLAEMLKQLKSAKDRILDAIDNGATEVVMFDALSTRFYSAVSYHGAPELSGGY